LRSELNLAINVLRTLIFLFRGFESNLNGARNNFKLSYINQLEGMSEGKTKELVVDMPENGEMRADALKEVSIVLNKN